MVTQFIIETRTLILKNYARKIKFCIPKDIKYLCLNKEVFLIIFCPYVSVMHVVGVLCEFTSSGGLPI